MPEIIFQYIINPNSNKNIEKLLKILLITMLKKENPISYSELLSSISLPNILKIYL